MVIPGTIMSAWAKENDGLRKRKNRFKIRPSTCNPVDLPLRFWAGGGLEKPFFAASLGWVAARGQLIRGFYAYRHWRLAGAEPAALPPDAGSKLFHPATYQPGVQPATQGR